MPARSFLRQAATVALVSGLLVGCGGSSADPDSSSAAATADLAAVSVSEGKGNQGPSVDVKPPFSVSKTVRRILNEGKKGQEVAVGQRVTIDYVGVNGTDGKQFDSSYAKEQSSSFVLDDSQVLKGMIEGLAGVNVGSRVLVAMPPDAAYGVNGAALGVGPTDTVVFLIDVKSAQTVLKRAEGTTVKQTDKALPSVKLDSKTGKPTITIPKTSAPKKLQVRTLIQGKGPTVKKGQSITAQYTGIVWATGKEFDSTWARGAEPSTFGIGTGQVIAGWDEGLVGKKVGSQVLLVIPPDKGYGAAGRPDAGLKGTDTLVFVVDILATSDS